MSTQHPLAAFRTSSAQVDLSKLAEEHYQHDLQPEDRERLQSSVSKIGTHASIGSLIGLGLGLFLAYRIRGNRKAMFAALRAHEKPISVVFEGGRTEAIPDITPYLRPSALGDAATYLFFSLSGLFIGGESGLLTGSLSASKMIKGDEESMKRIEAAFRKYRADVLRKEADGMDGGEGVLDKLF